MSPLQNKKVFFYRGPWTLCLLAAALLFSCAFVDLRPIGISTVPSEPWSLLPAAESPVIVRFDTAVEKSSAENAFQLSSPAGLVRGKFRWENNDLYFTPDHPWLPGIRYFLKLSGTITARDGRENPVLREIPFYAVSQASLPYLSSFSPPDNSSVAVTGTELELSFSHPMDRRSTEDALKLDLSGDIIYEWIDDDRTLSIKPAQALNPWAVYNWSLSERALSREGAPLAREYAGRFITDLNRDFIQVLRVLPLIPPLPNTGMGQGANSGTWGSWVPAAASLDQGPGPGHAIGVEFNKAPDSDSLRRAFSFIPSLPGRVEILSPLRAVFIPSRDPEPELLYSMRISGALRDNEGLRMGDDFVVTFIPDIPFLEVNSIQSISGENPIYEINYPRAGSIMQAQVVSGGIIRLVINFSLSFDSTVQEESVFKISLRPFFPATLPPLSLRSALWLASDKLFLEWEGPEGGSPNEPHYYRLLIPGGFGSLHNGRGSYLKEDLFLFLEAK